jgi:hypothetical protein
MSSNGGDLANSWRWFGTTMWQGEHRAWAMRLPLLASAADASMQQTR